MRLFTKETPLTARYGFSNADILRLKSCWIDTWEKYCAYAKTYSNVHFAGSDSFANMIGNDVYTGIQQAKVPRRQMGCSISEARLKQMVSAYCGSISSDGTAKPIGYALGNESALPHEVKLMDCMPAIRDQGQRGTCVAFASIALCEFAEKCQYDLSPQFLYWSCKRRDDIPNITGTYLATAQEALYEDGVCEERLWPYCPNPLVNDHDEVDEGQGPAPEDAVEYAQYHKFSCRPLSSNAYRQYKKILASGKPVVVAVAVFNSWMTNPYTWETGCVPMPYMEMNNDGVWHLVEKIDGAHAMCLVGYVDDDSVPGGGYFIVRNSWGQDWAAKCKEGAGHALIPYRYIAMFTDSAFTLSDDLSTHQKNSNNYGMNKKVTTSNTDIYPLKLQWSNKAISEYNAVLSRKQEFCAKIDDNLSASNLKNVVFPQVDSSWNLTQLMCETLIGATKEICDFRNELLDALLLDIRSNNENSAEIPIPWKETMKQLVSAKIRKIMSLALFPDSVYVVEAFTTPFAIDKLSGICSLSKPTASLIETIRACAEKQLGAELRKAKFIFYTIGTGLPFASEATTSRTGISSFTISSPSENGYWSVKCSDYLAAHPSFCDFSERMMPMTKADCINLVKIHIDNKLHSQSTNTVTIDELLNSIENDDQYKCFPRFRTSTVIQAVLQLQRNDPEHYAVFTNSKYGSQILISTKLYKGDKPFKG